MRHTVLVVAYSACHAVDPNVEALEDNLDCTEAEGIQLEGLRTDPADRIEVEVAHRTEADCTDEAVADGKLARADLDSSCLAVEGDLADNVGTPDHCCHNSLVQIPDCRLDTHCAGCSLAGDLLVLHEAVQIVRIEAAAVVHMDCPPDSRRCLVDIVSCCWMSCVSE